MTATQHASSGGQVQPSPSQDVVLVDAAGQPIGVAPKATVHSATTQRHLAFSSYLFNAAGELLLTRRALTKQTWPGVWTNTACGHPRPGHDITAEVAHRAGFELGATVEVREALLPDFAYRATDVSGIVEDEVCPVYRIELAPGATLAPRPDEVCDWAWVPWPAVVAMARSAAAVLSPWCVLQVTGLDDVGWTPSS